ncbi:MULTISPECIES: glycosyltransferase family 25 protein [Citrobacter]|uniref:glycosyltransferase family 25 protein n=1 Tax=Citrobacter TaxID=544 RepID=UPI0025750416|nr:glycosyltransferase family 25 protein [Citrobacter sp. Cu231]MDM2744846.1 glycosyltransferase family 25 protein [Citrobacter sp. Cu231]
MIKIYIVSLKKDNARRTNLSNQLKKLNIPFEIIDAVEGNLLDALIIDNYNKKAIYRYKRLVGPNEIGCSLSHQKVYLDIIKNKIEWAIILEDDVNVKVDFLTLIKNKIYQFDKDNLYILGGQNGLLSKKMQQTSFFNKIELNKTFFLEKAIKSEKYIFRTCCYMINNNVAKKLVEKFNNEFFIADDWLTLKKDKIIKHIFISDMIDHPTDLSDSSIELERQGRQKKKIKLISFFKTIYCYLRNFYKLGM